MQESSQDNPLCLVFVPSLVAVLLRAERLKGSPLTEAEVTKIRDESTTIALPFSVAVESEKQRGYPDIVPENVWTEWQRVRLELLA